MSAQRAVSLVFACSCILVSAVTARADDGAEKRRPAYVELTGRAASVRFYERSVTRPSYADPNDKPFFVFEMRDEAGHVMAGESAVIIGRHTTRYYGMKVSPTFNSVKPDWKNARIRVIGRLGIDNPFAAKGGDAGHVTHFPEAGKLPSQRTITAYIVEWETAPHKWSVWYYNNWFHGSEDEILNATITRHFAERKLAACTNESLDVLMPLLLPSDLQRLHDAGFKSGLMVGHFAFGADKTIRLVPSHYFEREKKITLAK